MYILLFLGLWLHYFGDLYFIFVVVCVTILNKITGYIMRLYLYNLSAFINYYFYF